MVKYSNDDWWDVNAPLGTERRYNHGSGCKDYGEGPDNRGRLFVKRTTEGWVWHCHNCGASGVRKYSYKDSQLVCSEIWGGSRLSKQLDEHIPDFRWPTKSAFTREAWEWLHKYHITDEEIRRYGIYYTQEYGGRVVLPIPSKLSRNDPFVGFQARSLWNQLGQSVEEMSVPKYNFEQKYLTRIIKGEENVRWRNYTRDDNYVILVVEDIISAIVVGRAYNSLALLGSPKHLPSSLALELEQFKHVIFWLDRDKAVTAEGYMKRMNSLFETKASMIIAEKDPKCYSEEEIKRLVQSTLSLTNHDGVDPRPLS